MSDGVGCFFEQERVELSEAAKNYDDVYCAGCPHHADCKALNTQEAHKPKGGSQDDSY